MLLCCLEGKSRDEAASELGCESGAIKGRLERGRELLRKRLAKRGIAFSAPLLAVFLSPGAGQAALPPLVAVAALKAVSGTASAAGATALANVVLRGILLTKLKAAAAVVLAAGIVGGLSTAAVEWLPGSGGKAVPVVAAFRLPPERRDTTPPEVAAVDDEIDASPAGPQPPLRLGKPSLVARFEGIDVERWVALFIEKKEHAPPPPGSRPRPRPNTSSTAAPTGSRTFRPATRSACIFRPTNSGSSPCPPTARKRNPVVAYQCVDGLGRPIFAGRKRAINTLIGHYQQSVRRDN